MNYAFPYFGDAAPHDPGMTLRDYFAATVLPTLLVICKDDTMNEESYPEHCARLAYEQADWMVARSNAPPIRNRHE